MEQQSALLQRGEQIPLSDAFRRDYAQLIQWLAKLNEHLAKFIDEINQICRQVSGRGLMVRVEWILWDLDCHG